MRDIELSQGFVALVDDEDFDFLNQWKWTAHKPRNVFYAVRNDVKSTNYKRILMHRVVVGAKSGMVVDHIDGNGLNNQKSNLRICTNSQNLQNSSLRLDNKSGYKGVSWNTRDKKFVCWIQVNGRSLGLGSYDDPIMAAQAYDRKALELFGEFARLNFPKEDYE